MRAITLTSFGGLDGVVLTDVAEPEMPDDAVTVRVHAVALAKWDVTTTEGVFVAMGGMTTFPQVLGWDFAGVISSAGSSVAGWEPGDRVLGFSPQPWTGTGVIAELVIGDAGAVGGVVVQLGRDRGARMIASAGSADFGRVRDLGAADAVDRAGDVAAQVKDLVPEGADVTIDLVGPAVWQSALAATRTGGRLITTSGPGSLPDVERGITALPVKVQPDAASLTSLAERYANRSLTMTTTVAGVFPLPRARQALEAVSRGKGREKYVLDLQQ